MAWEPYFSDGTIKNAVDPIPHASLRTRNYSLFNFLEPFGPPPNCFQ